MVKADSTKKVDCRGRINKNKKNKNEKDNLKKGVGNMIRIAFTYEGITFFAHPPPPGFQ